LTSSAHYVEHLFGQGKIESKDHKQLIEEIDSKIYGLTQNNVKVDPKN